MTTDDTMPPMPRDEIESAKVALSLITAAAGGREAFTKAAPLLLDGLVTSDDPVESAVRYISVAWWIAHQARVCGGEMDRLAGDGYFAESLRHAGECLAIWPQLEDVT